MYVVNGRIKARSSFADLAKKLEAGMGPIVKRAAGFRGHYIVDTGDGAGEGVLVFDTLADYEAVQPEIIAWYEKNISPLLADEEGTVSQGEVIVSVEPDGMPSQAGAQTGAEARPH